MYAAGNQNTGQIGFGLQVPALVKGGFRVIAPDLRGAINGESDAPKDVQAYNLTKVLVKDVAGICTLRSVSHSAVWTLVEETCCCDAL